MNGITSFFLISGTVYFNHSHGCQKCSVIGTYDKRMSFLTANNEARTDFSLRNHQDPLHHKTTSILEPLLIDMVQDFPSSDPLHLLELGVMKRMLKIWLEKIRYMTKSAAENISKMLIVFNKSKPCELHRSFRELKVLAYLKGTELHSFLLYTGIVVLKHHLNNNCYEHFLKLYCAVTLCYCNYYKKYYN